MRLNDFDILTYPTPERAAVVVASLYKYMMYDVIAQLRELYRILK